MTETCLPVFWGSPVTTALCAIMNEVKYDDDIEEGVVWDVNDIDDMWGVAAHWWWLPYSLQVTRSMTRGALGRPHQNIARVRNYPDITILNSLAC